MSRQRSRSPRYRTSPPRHEGAGSHSRRPPLDYVESHMGLTETDEIPFERNRHPRDDTGEHWNYFRKDTPHAAKRRTPPSLLWLPTLHPHPHPKEYGRRTPPSQPREPGYVERRRLSPKQPLYRHEGGGRGRGHSRVFENDERQHQSPQKLPRERFLPNPTAPSHHNHQQQREPAINLARENRGRSRDSGAQSTSHDHGQREGRKDPQGPYKERRRAEPHHERSPALSSRHRREMDDALNHGYGKEEEFSSPEKPRDAFGGGDRELRGPQKASSHREDRGARPVIVEHDHGIINSGPSQWEPRDLDLDGESRPLQKGSLHEQFRRMNRSNAREELRHHRPLHDDNGEPGRVNRAIPREELGYRPLHEDDADPGRDREQSRSPVRRDRTSPTGFPDRDGSPSYGDRSIPDRGRGRMNPSWGRRMGTGPPRNHPPVHHTPQERKGPPQQPQRRENRSAGAGDFYIGSREEDPGWTEEDMEPKMPRGREHKWNSQQTPKEMTVVTEETLTIKVDMSRPVNQNSQQCFSSDRQLSLDLVNVGRQRLDFLPMLEHSGTYRESSMHTGTFAQEIISLVHQVKELYFGGYGTTLTERFAVLKEGGPPEKEHAVEEQITLNRRFNMNKTVLPEDDEPLFPRLGAMHNDSLFSRLGDMQPPRQQQQQMVRDPGDLRYDLDRRRQERLEGVKVTIPGGGPKQHPLGVRSDQNAEYDDQESNDRGETEGFSGWPAEEQLERSWSGEEPQDGSWSGEVQQDGSWSGEVQQQGRWSGQGQQQRRLRGNMGPRRGAPNRQNSPQGPIRGAPNRQNSPQGPRRGAPHRQNAGPQRRTHRPGNRPGQMRWQNNRDNVNMHAGANW